MPKYQLRYLNVRGRAETTRMILAAAGVEYDDIRFEDDEWLKEKETGRLAGKDNLENAQIDMITDVFEDLLQGLIKIYYEKDEEKKKVMESEYHTNKVPVLLGGLEKLLKDNNGGDGYFVGDGITWADLAFLAQIDYNLKWKATVLDDYPKLEALRQRVMALPKIAAWLEKRPKTEF
ncbi:hematopoietic prostaglandin D synthase-like isoform X2 [Glandiceps talaboti]